MYLLGSKSNTISQPIETSTALTCFSDSQGERAESCGENVVLKLGVSVLDLVLPLYN